MFLKWNVNLLLNGKRKAYQLQKLQAHIKEDSLVQTGTKMTKSETLNKYKKVVKELNKGASLRRAAAIGKCSLGTAQRVYIILNKNTSLSF